MASTGIIDQVHRLVNTVDEDGPPASVAASNTMDTKPVRLQEEPLEKLGAFTHLAAV